MAYGTDQGEHGRKKMIDDDDDDIYNYDDDLILAVSICPSITLFP